MKRGGPKAPTTLLDPLGIIHHLNEKANAIMNCTEDQFTSHDLCEENHEGRVETRAQALLASAEDTMLGNIRPCDIHKFVNSLKLRNACGLDGFPNKCLKHVPRIPLVHVTYLLNHCLQLSHYPKSWEEAKVITLLKPDKDPKVPQYLCLICLLSTQASYSRKLF
jgi:hypothetical protein